LDTKRLISIDEKSEVAISFFEELKFKHDHRVQAEQTLRDTVEYLLNYHERE
ncbi:7864_t:CDS:1, partial [Acaulospora colombiana]